MRSAYTRPRLAARQQPRQRAGLIELWCREPVVRPVAQLCTCMFRLIPGGGRGTDQPHSPACPSLHPHAAGRLRELPCGQAGWCARLWPAPCLLFRIPLPLKFVHACMHRCAPLDVGKPDWPCLALLLLHTTAAPGPASSCITALQHAQRLRVHQSLLGQPLVPLVWLSTELWPSTHSAAETPPGCCCNQCYVINRVFVWCWNLLGFACEFALWFGRGLREGSRAQAGHKASATSPARPLFRPRTTLSKHTHTQLTQKKKLSTHTHTDTTSSSKMQTKGIARSGIRGTPVVSRNARRMAAPVSRGAMSIRAEKVRGYRAPASCSCSSTTSSSKRGVHGQVLARRAHLDCVRAGGGH